jgi:hypothetical protein
VSAATVPAPITDHPIGRSTADFSRPRHRLIVRPTAGTPHNTPTAFVDGRIRNAELAHDLPATIGRVPRWFAGSGRRRAA